MARFFLHHYRTDEVDGFRSGSAVSHDIPQRMFDGGKETGADLTIGGEPNARTGAAERFGYRRDDTDLARRSVSETISRSCFRAAIEIEGDEWKSFVNACANLATGYHVLARPLVSGIQRH